MKRIFLIVITLGIYALVTKNKTTPPPESPAAVATPQVSPAPQPEAQTPVTELNPPQSTPSVQPEASAPPPSQPAPSAEPITSSGQEMPPNPEPQVPPSQPPQV